MDCVDQRGYGSILRIYRPVLTTVTARDRSSQVDLPLNECGYTMVAHLLLIALFSISAFASPPYKSYLAICAVGRNENAYVKEWVDYHLCLGR